MKFAKGNGFVPALKEPADTHSSDECQRRSGEANLKMTLSRRPGHSVREQLSDWGSLGKGGKASGGQQKGVSWVMGLFCPPSKRGPGYMC